MFRCVLVDDEPIIRSSLKKKVEEYDDSVTVVHSATDGLEALAYLDDHYADLCITDVKMPNMNGLELISAINERFPWMICIVVSSYNEFTYVKQSMRLDAIDYVLKPVDSADLKEVLDKALSQLSSSRASKANHLLLNKLPLHNEMLNRWNEMISSHQHEDMPLLVVDTLEMLEDWAKNRHYLLPYLAVQWLDFTLESLIKRDEESNNIQLERILEESREWVKYDRKKYFRMSAVNQLEVGAHHLLNVIRRERDQKGTRIIALTKKYIQEHYGNKLTIQEVADAVTMSRTYLASLFKQETKMTILNYVVSVRMEKARELLLNTSMKIYEITTMVGYEDSIHFSKLFKETYGLGPVEYKKKRLGG